MGIYWYIFAKDTIFTVVIKLFTGKNVQVKTATSKSLYFTNMIFKHELNQLQTSSQNIFAARVVKHNSSTS